MLLSIFGHCVRQIEGGKKKGEQVDKKSLKRD